MKLSDYIYDLPEERIAKYPLKDRSSSKLLVYKNGSCSDQVFNQLNTYLPENAALYFNNTEVIPARLFFQKETGANIEIFLLHPISPTNIVQHAMEVKGEAIWECMIGNSKKWKEDNVLQQSIQINDQTVKIEARRVPGELKQARISWPEEFQFSEIVEALGNIPLPPYLNRDTEEEDIETYQTVYSNEKGAVAAPTAGLHFTDQILEELQNNNHSLNYLTLHVGAGTFMPVKHDNPLEHPMHNEQIVVTKDLINSVINNEFITSVGTTSMRSLESLYWFGVKLENDPEAKFFIEKLYPYDNSTKISKEHAFLNIADYLTKNNSNTLIGETEIFLFPGYEFKVCNALITNFHQPSSTLLMLIAAFIGEDWRNMYQHALDNDYRFLSYGDSSILFR